MTFPTGNLTYEIEEMNPQERLREIILYIATVSQFDMYFGKTKLVKLLYMSDFEAFREHGKPVTGHKYIKWDNGPVPENLNQLLDDMRSKGEIVIQDVEFGYSHPQQRVIPLRPANLEAFTGSDIATVNALIQEHANRTGTEMAAMTHGIAWKSTDQNEPIPYEASILSDEALSQSDINYAYSIIERYGSDPDE